MKLQIIRGDITALKVDAIVNAANKRLMGGGGVDGAIHRNAGPKLLEDCKRIRNEEFPSGLPVGQATITKGYDLPARFVIHTVGPVYNRLYDQSNLLISCFRKSLDVAEENNVSSIAFPAISTGAYGYPVRDCAKAAKLVFDTYNFKNVSSVIICLFSEDDKTVFDEVFGQT